MESCYDSRRPNRATARKSRIGLLLAAAAILFAAPAARATTVTLDATGTGWWDSSGFHIFGNENYIVGEGGPEYHDYFVFDTSGVSGHVAAATLRLTNPVDGYSSPDPSETYAVFDVSTPLAELEAGGTGRTDIFADLGSGVVYGTRSVSGADNGQLVDVSLDAAALAAINSSLGTAFAMGGAITTLGSGSPEYLFAYTHDGVMTRQLILTLSDCGDGTLDSGEDCDEGAANGTSSSCCTSSCALRGSGEICRPVAGACDQAEACTGASPSCPTDQVQSASTPCRSVAGACDLAESCDGVSVECPADAKSTAECRAAQGVCDVAESCDGSSDDCPPDGKVSAGTACSATYSGFGGNGAGWTLNHGLGDDPVSVVADVLTITNNGFDDHNSAFLDTPKSISSFSAAFTYQAGGALDADGAAFVLHNDPAGPAAVGLSGGGGALGYSFIAPSAAVELNIWFGEGMGTGYYTAGQTAQSGGPPYISTLPVDLASGHPIRVTLSYDGATLTETLVDLTTSDSFTHNYTVDIPGAAGGSTAYIGFTGGTGGGNSIQTISDFSFSSEDDGTLCTVSQCDGANNACQSVAANAGTTCRASAGVCDPAELCDGTTFDCPADAKSTASCRAAVDACDVAEFCDGSNAACPADALAPAGSPCGNPTDTDCTQADTCDGAGLCLANDEPSGSPCGNSSASECDAADTCDNAGTCQANHVANGTACTSDGELCTVDQCDGGGLCAHPAGNAGTLCRSAAGTCDVAESCDGTTPACPPNGFQPSGTACGNPADSACSNPDTCDGGGACSTNNEPAGTSCSDGDACTSGDQCDGNDVCVAGAPTICPACELCNPTGGCTALIEMACESGSPGKSSLVISNSTNNSQDRVVFKWKSANAINKIDFGNPTADADYQLCVYDDKATPGLPNTLVYSIEAPAAGTCDGRNCWKDLTSGYLYKDNLLTPDGAQRVILKAGSAGKGRVLFKAKGDALGLVPHNTGVFFSQSDNVTVVLAAEHAPKCFKATFPRPWLKNLTSGYKDKN